MEANIRFNEKINTQLLKLKYWKWKLKILVSQIESYSIDWNKKKQKSGYWRKSRWIGTSHNKLNKKVWTEHTVEYYEKSKCVDHGHKSMLKTKTIFSKSIE